MMKHTQRLVLIESGEVKVEGGQVGVDKEGNGLVGTRQVGAIVVFFMRGQGICHALQYGVCA